MIEHLQARLRRAHQRAADAEAQSSQGQLEEQTAILQKACERVEQLEDANSQLQAGSPDTLHLKRSRPAAKTAEPTAASRGSPSEGHPEHIRRHLHWMLCHGWGQPDAGMTRDLCGCAGSQRTAEGARAGSRR